MSDKYDPFAAVAYASNGDPIEFENEIVRGLADKMYDAVEKKREEVARNMMGSTSIEEPSSEDNTNPEETPDVTDTNPEEDNSDEE